MKYIVMSLAIALASACSKESAAASHDRSANTPSSEEPVTAADQSNSPADLEITQTIRRNLMNDASLSTAAKNVTVVTQAGAVTLRGTVPTTAERDRIESISKAAAGVFQVHNRLEVKGN